MGTIVDFNTYIFQVIDKVYKDKTYLMEQLEITKKENFNLQKGMKSIVKYIKIIEFEVSSSDFVK